MSALYLANLSVSVHENRNVVVMVEGENSSDVIM